MYDNMLKDVVGVTITISDRDLRKCREFVRQEAGRIGVVHFKKINDIQWQIHILTKVQQWMELLFSDEWSKRDYLLEHKLVYIDDIE